MVVLALWAGLGTTVPAAGSSSTFADMLRGMATALALLGQSTNAGTGTPTIVYPQIQPFPVPAFPPAYPWAPPLAGYPPGYGAPPYTPLFHGVPPWGGAVPPYAPNTNPADILARLQGAWETNKGGLLLVKNNLARLYVTRDEYQDLYLRADPRFLWLQPVGSQVPARYEHHIYRDRIVLRDARGNSLVLRRYKPGKDSPRKRP